MITLEMTGCGSLLVVVAVEHPPLHNEDVLHRCHIHTWHVVRKGKGL